MISVRKNIHIPLFLLTFYLYVVIRNSYVMEDAYITLRVVDNFVNGYGLTWNTIERVQAYTHPLWMFLLSLGYFFTREAFYTTVAISVIVSGIAFMVVLIISSKNGMTPTILVAAILIFSKAYIDYSTSGMENPASHLLIAVFLYFCLEDSPNKQRSLFWIFFIANLAIINRMDSILMYLPLLLLTLLSGFPKEVTVKELISRLKWLFVGFVPFILWEIFSLVYYGFPFPNTAYAKLYFPEMSMMDLLEQGYIYFLDSLYLDPITLFVVALGLGSGILQGNKVERAAALGGGLYLAYIFYIGGDNMSGRFFSSVLVISVILLSRFWAKTRPLESFSVLAFIFALGLTSPLPTLLVPYPNSTPETETIPLTRFGTGATDVKRWLFSTSSLIFDRRDTIQPYHHLCYQGTQMKQTAEQGGETVYELGAVGYTGYFAGPNVYIIDSFALTNALLARLPPEYDANWRNAHFRRILPDGYFETIKTNENRIKDPSLAAYYDKLLVIIQAPIWSWERFQTIFEMNTGQYEHYLTEYRQNLSP